MFRNHFIYKFIAGILIVFPSAFYAQTPDLLPNNKTITNDTVIITNDTSIVNNDSIKILVDTILKSDIDDPVRYSADDSIVMTSDKRVLMYNNSVVKYTDIELSSYFVEYDFEDKTISSTGLPDSTGEIIGMPLFKDGGESYNAGEIRYNFKSKKAFIKNIRTEQGEGFLHSESTKRQNNGQIHIHGGKFTTCDLMHPHFYIALSKAITIPDKKIVSGPAYLVFEDVPLPLFLPFGYFPITKKQSSGLIIPRIGGTLTRGFNLQQGGWYFVFNDFIDYKITGDIYSNGTWGLDFASTYKKKYRYNGGLHLTYFYNVMGQTYDNTEKSLTKDITKEFKIVWNYTQDAKANPNSSFSANVNISSRNMDQNIGRNTQDVITNTKSSSINYTKRFSNSPFNPLNVSFNHSQNSLTGDVNLLLPKLSFSTINIYPFRDLVKNNNNNKWIQNIQISYRANMENRINSNDSILFNNDTWAFDMNDGGLKANIPSKDIRNGMEHYIPLSTTIRLLNLFTVSPSINYKGVMYANSIKKQWVADDITFAGNDTIVGNIINDTIRGFQYAHALYPSISVSVNPKIFGIYHFKKSRLQAIRHIISPTASLSFIPDMNKIMPNDYYDTVTNQRTGQLYRYSRFENGIYGTPISYGKSGSISIGINQNVEMKMLTKNDTTNIPVKKTLLNNLSIRTSYNMFAETFRWSPISMNTQMSVFKNMANIMIRGSIDPYSLNEKGIRIDTLMFIRDRKIGRLTNLGVSVGTNINSAGLTSKNNADANRHYEGYNDFKMPWSMNISYSLDYVKPYFESQLMQTINISGNINLTQKWGIGYRTGYDIKNKQVTLTTLNISRDLHCWSMNLDITPFGQYTSYYFVIRANSSILNDLKLEKQETWFDR